MTSILPPLNSYQASYSYIDISIDAEARITNKNCCHDNLSRNLLLRNKSHFCVQGLILQIFFYPFTRVLSNLFYDQMLQNHKFQNREGIKRISRYSINVRHALAIIIHASKSIGIKCLRRQKNGVHKMRVSMWRLADRTREFVS